MFCVSTKMGAVLTIAVVCSTVGIRGGVGVGCSLAYKPLEDVARAAPVVFFGNVVERATETWTVKIQVDKYLKGCGGRVVSLGGFWEDDEECEIYMPFVGNRIVACAKSLEDGTMKVSSEIS